MIFINFIDLKINLKRLGKWFTYLEFIKLELIKLVN